MRSLADQQQQTLLKLPKTGELMLDPKLAITPLSHPTHTHPKPPTSTHHTSTLQAALFSHTLRLPITCQYRCTCAARDRHPLIIARAACPPPHVVPAAGMALADAVPPPRLLPPVGDVLLRPVVGNGHQVSAAVACRPRHLILLYPMHLVVRARLNRG